MILTAACAKYRYIKLPLSDIEGVPRVLDAGQCNDSYSLVRIALTLKDVYYCPYVEPMYLKREATPIQLTAISNIATPGDASVANPLENLPEIL